jgi:hypothetical protein
MDGHSRPIKDDSMAEFIKIPALNIGRKGQWELVLELEYQSDHLVKPIIVPAGFETDLASIPRLFTPLVPKNGKHRAPAIVHDWLCRNKITSKKMTDKIFLEAMKVAKVSKWRRYAMFAAVRVASPWRKV